MIASALLFALSVLFELTVHLWPPRYLIIRKVWAVAAIVCMLGSLALLLARPLSLLLIVFVALFPYRMLNAARIFKNRMHAVYLQLAVLRTSLWLIAAQTILGALHIMLPTTTLSYNLVWMIGIALEIIAAGVILRAARKYQSVNPAAVQPLTTAELPTVSVAIPARNETEELQECITSLLASDYPKLEILVLDDCSQLTRTPEIIRGYANKGVRFIQGQEPQMNWLAKNQAYELLSQTSNGEILLFMGVDVRLQEHTIRQLVAYMTASNLHMVGTMPRNNIAGSNVPLLQPMRYFLEISLAGFSSTRAPVLSSCWLIRRNALQSLGGFPAVARMVIPESYLADRLSVRHAYRFLRGVDFGVTSTKWTSQQRDTAIRTAYPRLRRRPENAALLSLLVVSLIALPISLVIAGLLEPVYRLHALLSIVVLGLLLLAYRTVLIMAYGQARPLDTLSLPLALLLQLAMLHYSMYKYEFDEVIWKGRNVCIPAMHVVPKLPDF